MLVRNLAINFYKLCKICATAKCETYCITVRCESVCGNLKLAFRGLV